MTTNGHWDIVMDPIEEPAQGWAEHINDHELRDAYVRGTGRRRASLRGHDL
jgi:hypothetical protein